MKGQGSGCCLYPGLVPLGEFPPAPPSAVGATGAAGAAGAAASSGCGIHDRMTSAKSPGLEGFTSMILSESSAFT